MIPGEKSEEMPAGRAVRTLKCDSHFNFSMFRQGEKNDRNKLSP